MRTIYSFSYFYVYLDHNDGFQLGADASDPDGYYQTGDWHDVFYRPSTVTAGAIYFSVDQHTGKAVMHCHFLEHEDKGCMAYLDITAGSSTTTGLAGTALVSTAAATTTTDDTTTTTTTDTTDATTTTPPSPPPPTTVSSAAAGSFNQLYVAICTVLSSFAAVALL